MYLRLSKQKRVDGSVIGHYQFAESVWDKDKKSSRTKIVYTFGRTDEPRMAEQLAKLARSILRRTDPQALVAHMPDFKLVEAWPFGPLFVLETLWERLRIKAILEKLLADRHFDFPVERAIFAMVANRALAPSSKLYCYDQWLAHDVRIKGTEDLSLHHLYRAMDFVLEHREQLEREIFMTVSEQLGLQVDLLFYDTTTLHFEIKDEDEGDEALRKRGYSKDGRGDVPQLVVGLAVTRDGLPVCHWVFPGNTVDVTTVEKVKEQLRGWKLGRCVFVGDAGMVSAENLRTLALGGGKYIVSMPVHKGGEVAKQVMTRAGRFATVAQNLRVKEVWLDGDGERRRRYIVCHNPAEAQRARAHRDKLIEALEAELASLKQLEGGAHSKRACRLRANRRFSRYLRQTKTGRLRIDRGAIKAAERLDGRFIVHSNDDSLSAEDLALGYKQLMRVEQCWRTLKSGLAARPIFHRAEHRIRAHIQLNILALLLERVVERACGDSWRTIRDELSGIKLAQLSGPNGMLWQVTEPRKDARNRLESLEIDNLPLIVNYAL